MTSCLQADWKRKCKTVLEVDRNEAAREQGYTVSLYKLMPPHACPKNDVLVGTVTAQWTDRACGPCQCLSSPGATA